MWRFPLLSANDIRFGLWPKLRKEKAQGMLWQAKTDLALRRVGLEQPPLDERAQCIGGTAIAHAQHRLEIAARRVLAAEKKVVQPAP